MKNIAIRIAFLLFSGSYFSFSQSIITDRPDQTESAVTLEKGRLQIESGILIQTEGEGANQLNSLAVPTNLFRYGISSKVELRLVLQLDGAEAYGDDTYQYALGNIELGSKIVLNKKEDPTVQWALLSHLFLPGDDWGQFSEQVGFLNRLSIAHTIGEKVNVGCNIGYNHYAGGRGNYLYTLAIGYGLNDKWSVYVEPYGAVFTSSPPLSNFDYGLAYLVNDILQLDLSFGSGLNNPMNYQSLGVSWRQKAKEKENQ
jgi:hypothetical protein